MLYIVNDYVLCFSILWIISHKQLLSRFKPLIPAYFER